MHKILIVDDNPDMREIIQVGLRRAALSFLTADNGREALQTALREKPDLVLLDVMIPPPDGMEVCRRLKAQMESFTPVVLMTAQGALDNKVRGFEHGADDFLVKPFAMEELTSRVSSMLRIKTLHDDLRRSSLTDPLTGAYNRRGLEGRLAPEFRRAVQGGVPFSCLLVDVDRMKSINDAHGHTVGDKALLHVVRVLRRHLRAEDGLARHGGDEFIAVLPGLGVDPARGLAERVRATLSLEPLEIPGHRLPITVSIGVAMFPMPGVTDLEAFFTVLDDALYNAKHSGRNGVYTISPGRK